MADKAKNNEKAEDARTVLNKHRDRLADLKTKQSPRQNLWRDLADFYAPSRYRPEETDTEQGARLARPKIIDAHGSIALRTAAHGMYSVTSPSRPWARYGPADPDMVEYGPVKEWFATAEKKARQVFATSNLYASWQIGSFDRVLFGERVALLTEDRYDYIRSMPLVHGEFWMANDERGRTGILYRRMRMTVEQMVWEFGYEACSRTVKNLYDKSQYGERVTVYHAVEKRYGHNPDKLDAKNKPYTSNYWEDAATPSDGLLRESGFSHCPIIGSRWLAIGNDDYGESPAMETLPDVKMLQKEETLKLKGIEKQVDPPMQGPTSLRNEPKSHLPGSVTYVDDPTGPGFRPTMSVNIQLDHLHNDIQNVHARIDRGLFSDLFRMWAEMNGVQPRNELEILRRNEEQLLQLGPVLENVYQEDLNPTHDFLFYIMGKRGLLPPAPPEIRGQEIKVDYISQLASAQKAVSTGGIDRLFAHVGRIAPVQQGVLDKIDFDQSVDEYADALGVPPRIVRPDDKVKQMREDRAKAEQQQKQLDMAAQAAPAMKQGAQAVEALTAVDPRRASGSPAELLANLGIG